MSAPSADGRSAQERESDSARTREVVLRAEGIARSFGAVAAVRGVSIELRAGEITALVGDNGAGKSTLVKIISGADWPDEGSIFVEGRPVAFRDPLEARSLGIESVYQDLAVAPDLDVVSNLFLGREVRYRGLRRLCCALDRRHMRARARESLDELEISIPSLDVALKHLSGGQRQAVAVARGVMWATKVIVLDEPTAALGITESGKVLDLVTRVRRKGLAVLMVSHNLPEVFEVGDRIVVMRHGERAADLARAATDMEEVVGYVTGARRAQ